MPKTPGSRNNVGVFGLLIPRRRVQLRRRGIIYFQAGRRPEVATKYLVVNHGAVWAADFHSATLTHGRTVPPKEPPISWTGCRMTSTGGFPARSSASTTPAWLPVSRCHPCSASSSRRARAGDPFRVLVALAAEVGDAAAAQEGVVALNAGRHRTAGEVAELLSVPMVVADLSPEGFRAEVGRYRR